MKARLPDCSRGWWYEPPIPPKEQIDREIAAVFARHPRLNLILPHFFFLSDQLEKAARLLERYPGFYLDLAPGVEMLHNFTSVRLTECVSAGND